MNVILHHRWKWVENTEDIVLDDFSKILWWCTENFQGDMPFSGFTSFLLKHFPEGESNLTPSHLPYLFPKSETLALPLCSYSKLQITNLNFRYWPNPDPALLSKHLRGWRDWPPLRVAAPEGVVPQHQHHHGLRPVHRCHPSRKADVYKGGLNLFLNTF